jgi:hypothetical protein
MAGRTRQADPKTLTAGEKRSIVEIVKGCEKWRPLVEFLCLKTKGKTARFAVELKSCTPMFLLGQAINRGMEKKKVWVGLLDLELEHLRSLCEVFEIDSTYPAEWGSPSRCEMFLRALIYCTIDFWKTWFGTKSKILTVPVIWAGALEGLDNIDLPELEQALKMCALNAREVALNPEGFLKEWPNAYDPRFLPYLQSEENGNARTNAYKLYEAGQTLATSGDHTGEFGGAELVDQLRRLSGSDCEAYKALVDTLAQGHKVLYRKTLKVDSGTFSDLAIGVKGPGFEEIRDSKLNDYVQKNAHCRPLLDVTAELRSIFFTDVYGGVVSPFAEKKFPAGWEKDHIVLRSLGEAFQPHNRQHLHHKANSMKSGAKGATLHKFFTTKPNGEKWYDLEQGLTELINSGPLPLLDLHPSGIILKGYDEIVKLQVSENQSLAENYIQKNCAGLLSEMDTAVETQLVDDTYNGPLQAETRQEHGYSELNDNRKPVEGSKSHTTELAPKPGYSVEQGLGKGGEDGSLTLPGLSPASTISRSLRETEAQINRDKLLVENVIRRKYKKDLVGTVVANKDAAEKFVLSIIKIEAACREARSILKESNLAEKTGNPAGETRPTKHAVPSPQKTGRDSAVSGLYISSLSQTF